jgi:hypothetical protein
MSSVNPLDFFERESEENHGDDTPTATENDWVEVETNDRSRMDDTATKDGEQPKADGNTNPGTETPKRARVDPAPIDEVDNSAAKLAMTEDQFAMAKKLVVNAAKQGLSFSESTTMKLTDKSMVYQTAEALLELTHPDGSKSDKFGCFGVFVSDPTKSTLIP